MISSDQITNTIINIRNKANREIALLMAISGIDASGKGTFTKNLYRELIMAGYNVAVISADKWLQPNDSKINPMQIPETFYENCYRWNELFTEVLIPLKNERSLYLEKELVHIANNQPYLQAFRYSNIDIILFEGIFLFKNEWRKHYDLSVWIECNFNTALKRALIRNQEELTIEGLLNDYKKIYFPAQHIHFRKDNPKVFADVVL